MKRVKSVVEANEFVLKDQSGKVRARLGLTRTGPSLQMHDTSGQVLMGLELSGGEPSLRLYDKRGKVRFWLSLDSGREPSIMLYGPHQNYSLWIGVRSDEPQIVLYGQKSTPSVEICSGPNEQGISVRDTNLEGSIDVGVRDGFPALTALHSGLGRLEIGVNEKGPQLEMDDADRSPVYSAP